MKTTSKTTPKFQPAHSKLEPIEPTVLLWTKVTLLTGTTALAMGALVWAWQTSNTFYILCAIALFAVNLLALNRSKRLFKQLLGLDK